MLWKTYKSELSVPLQKLRKTTILSCIVNKRLKTKRTYNVLAAAAAADTEKQIVEVHLE